MIYYNKRVMFDYDYLAWGLQAYGRMGTIAKSREMVVNVGIAIGSMLRNKGIAVGDIKAERDNQMDRDYVVIDFDTPEDLLAFKLIYAEDVKMLRNDMLDDVAELYKD